MTFSKLVDSVNSTGPFQFLLVVLLGLPILGMANHNLLQIFTAATPAHHCRPPPNASAGPWLLPVGPGGKPEPCLRFMSPPNASLPNDTRGATEPCLDGWAYNSSTGDSIVTEVRTPEAALCRLRAGPRSRVQLLPTRSWSPHSQCRFLQPAARPGGAKRPVLVPTGPRQSGVTATAESTPRPPQKRASKDCGLRP